MHQVNNNVKFSISKLYMFLYALLPIFHKGKRTFMYYIIHTFQSVTGKYIVNAFDNVISKTRHTSKVYHYLLKK